MRRISQRTQFRNDLKRQKRRGKDVEELIEPDWLLIYEVTATEVLLIRTGTHSDLFTR